MDCVSVSVSQSSSVVGGLLCVIRESCKVTSDVFPAYTGGIPYVGQVLVLIVV